MIRSWETTSNSLEILLFVFGALALELKGSGTEGLRNVFVHGEPFEVDGVNHGQQMQRDVERELGVVDEIADDGVVFAEDAIGGDQAKNFVGKVGHGGEGFDFLVSEARGLEDGALD